MKNPFSAHSRSVRRARKKGRHHGKSNHPHETWGDTPVPYLEKLHAQFSAKIHELQNEWRIYQGQSVTLTEEDTANKSAQVYEVATLEAERSLYEEQIKKLLEEKHGLPNENPVGKAARTRVVSLPLYWVAISMLAIGEYLVTLPAVAKILNDEGLKGWLITASFSFLSIICAHIIGLTLKMQADRVNPQPRWQIWGMAILALFVTIVILLLSAIRSDSVQSVPFSFGLSMTAFGTLLFFVVQMSFVLSAMALSYFNHAEVEVQLDKSKRKVKRITRKIKRISKAKMIPGRTEMTPEKRRIQREALQSAMWQFEAEYRELCAEYRGANLLAQAEAMAATGHGLIERPLQLPELNAKTEDSQGDIK
jgi:uncharacterized membrane protein YciS (DUF1049 family)